MSYTAPKHEIDDLARLFSKIGFPLTGISIVPFALQNLFRTNWIETEGKNVCSLFIGRDWSRIAIFSKENLVLSRDIKAGIQSMTEAIREKMDEKLARLSVDSVDTSNTAMDGALVEKTSAQTDQAQHVFQEFIHDSPSVKVEGIDLDFDEEEIFETVLPALDRVVRQVERTIEHYHLNFGKEVVDKLYISGPVGNQPMMVDYINDQLGLPIDTIDPFSRAYVSKEVAVPESIPERSKFVSAVGMALSNNSLTPNFIFTHKNKEKAAVIDRINQSIFVVFLVLIAIGIGVSFWQSRLYNQKQAQIDQLQMQLDSFSPLVDQNLIIKAAAQTNHKIQRYKEFSNKYLGMAVTGIISGMTPSNIRLLSIQAELGVLPGTKTESKKKVLVLEGIVFGDLSTVEAALASYMLKLKDSPLFKQFNINNRSFEFVEDKEVLRFIAQLELA